MNKFVPILGLLLLPLTQLSAQVKAEVTLDREQFLPGEALPIAVKIRNHSGRTLHMGDKPDWLTFSVESDDGYVVTKTGEPPVVGKFTLKSAQVATKRVDLAPYFTLTRPGRYNIIASVHINEWNGEVTSPPKHFDIITAAQLWAQDFGVPVPPGVTNQPPEIRRYILQEANYVRKRLWLYLRLTDQSETRIIKVVPIGPMVGLSRPENQVDQASNLHILYQNGAHTFSYTVVNPDGEIVVRQTYEYIDSRPRLRAGNDGKIVVVGGVRFVTNNDIPAPKENKDTSRPARP